MRSSIEHTLNQSFRIAHFMGNSEVNPEHLMMALLNDSMVRHLLLEMAVDVVRLKRKLYQLIRQSYQSDEQISQIRPSIHFERIMHRSMQHATSFSKTAGVDVGVINSLLAVVETVENENNPPQFATLLADEGIRRSKLMHVIEHTMEDYANAPKPEEGESGRQDSFRDEEEMEEEGDDPIEQYTIDLNERAAQQQIDPLVGRKLEVERLVQVLCRRKKSNPLLVGEPGVGKTAIVEGLASMIQRRTSPAALLDKRVLMLDLGALLSGTKYRGDLEKRIQNLVAELRERPDIILFIDEIHMLIGAGATSGGTMDASNLLKPILSKGEIRCIGATTFKEYQTIIEKDGAFNRRFQKIEVLEPSREEMIKILTEVTPLYEKFHKVRYDGELVESVLDLADRYLHDRFYPDKALDLLDEVGAAESAARTIPANEVKRSRQKLVTKQHLSEALSRMTGVPVNTLKTQKIAPLP